MSKYRCTVSRRIADNVYVIGDAYEISDELAARYRGYFVAVPGQPEPAKAPAIRAPKASSAL